MIHTNFGCFLKTFRWMKIKTFQFYKVKPFTELLGFTPLIRSHLTTILPSLSQIVLATVYIWPLCQGIRLCFGKNNPMKQAGLWCWQKRPCPPAIPEKRDQPASQWRDGAAVKVECIAATKASISTLILLNLDLSH